MPTLQDQMVMDLLVQLYPALASIPDFLRELAGLLRQAPPPPETETLGEILDRSLSPFLDSLQSTVQNLTDLVATDNVGAAQDRTERQHQELLETLRDLISRTSKRQQIATVGMGARDDFPLPSGQVNQLAQEATLRVTNIALAPLATQATLAQVKTDLDSIAAEDFATQTTLALVKANTDTLDVALSTVAKDASIGTDGAVPPVIVGTGVRGWLRAIYEKVAGTLTVAGTVAVSSLPEVEIKNDSGNPVPVSVSSSVEVEVKNDTGNAIPVDTELPAAIAAADGMANPTAPQVISHLAMLSSGGLWNRAQSCLAIGDNQQLGGALPVGTYQFNGLRWDRPRTPSIFKAALATGAGNTALWTPASGRKFRILRYMVEVTANASTVGGASITIDLQDAGATLNLTHTVFLPALSPAGALAPAYISPWIDLGNGRLSAVANNVLNVNLSAALATGSCRVRAVGTEE